MELVWQHELNAPEAFGPAMAVFDSGVGLTVAPQPGGPWKPLVLDPEGDVRARASGGESVADLAAAGDRIVWARDRTLAWTDGDLTPERTLDAGRPVTTVALSSSGRRLATANSRRVTTERNGVQVSVRDKVVHVWDDESGPMELVGHRGPALDLLFLNEEILFSAGGDGALKAWDLETGSEMASTPEGPAQLESLAVSDELGLVASGSRDGVLRLWSFSGFEPVRDLTGGAGLRSRAEIRSIAFSPSGHRLAASTQDKSLGLWDSDGWKKIRHRSARWVGDDPVQSVAFLADDRLVVGCRRRVLCLAL